MPRARKTQPIEVPSGQAYGERQAQEESLGQVPMPDRQRMNEMQLHQQAVQGATAMTPPPEGGLFGAPSMRPNEPTTAGLKIGPGAGPEALRMMTQRKSLTQRHLEDAAEMTGNPKLAEMARRAQRPAAGPTGR